MIGIVLAGGSGTRLHPLTKVSSKQLLPVYDKPMIFYPISTLMLAEIREIVVITTPQDQDSFKKLLDDGSQIGVSFHFLTQKEPKGLAEAFTISETFITGEKTALILGDNIFHGKSLGSQLANFQDIDGAQIFGYRVANPKEYGVVQLDSNSKPISIIEKPISPVSNLAVPGLYFYDETVLEKSRRVKPSTRGELEISSINQMYLEEDKLSVEVLQRGTAWLDTGTFESLFEASSYVRILQERQGNKIACLEEIAFRKKWITPEQLEFQIQVTSNQEMKIYLKQILDGEQ
jgi:glucose-1-phosphate thymidylyltransferase